MMIKTLKFSAEPAPHVCAYAMSLLLLIKYWRVGNNPHKNIK